LGDHEAGASGGHERELHVSPPPREEVGPGAKRQDRVGAIKSLQPPTAALLLFPRNSGRKAARPARACRPPRPACRRGCERCGEIEARSRLHVCPTVVSSRMPPPARPLV